MALMRIRMINLSKVVKHQLSFDENLGTDKAITFTIGALDARVMAAIKDESTGIPISALSGGDQNANATLNLSQSNFRIVLFGLKGWENLMDDEDKQVAFKTVHTNLNGKTYVTADPDLISRLPSEVIEELASEIANINSLKEEERKNLEE